MSNGNNTILPLTLKRVTPADNLVVIAEKTQFNFDQILLHGGGRKGDPGDEGRRGLPGATGKGDKGDPGNRGSQLYFSDDPISDLDPVTNPDHKEGDTVIDKNDGAYYKVIDVSGELKYSFQFNINDPSTISPYWIDQAEYVPDSTTHILVSDHPKRNVLIGRKDVDTTEYYRIMLGINSYPYPVGVNNTTAFIANILPSAAGEANDTFFSQIGLKFRNSATTGLSANTTWIGYKEEATENRYLCYIENSTVGAYLKHDTTSADDSEYVIKGSHVKFVGKSPMNSWNYDNVTEFLDFHIEENLTTIEAQKSITIKPDTYAGSVIIIQHETAQFSGTDNIFLYNPFRSVNIQSDCDVTIATVGSNLIVNTMALDLETDELFLGVSSGGATWADVNLRKDVYIQQTADEALGFNVPIRVMKEVLVERHLFDCVASKELDLASRDRVLIWVREDSGYRTIQNITNGTSKQVIVLIADDTIILESGGNILITEDHIMRAGDSVVLWKNYGSGFNYEIIAKHFTHQAPGYESRTMLSSHDLVELHVDTSKSHQRVGFTSTAWSVDHEIRLKREHAVAGNTFFIIFDGNNINMNGYRLIITDDSPSTIRKEFSNFNIEMIEGDEEYVVMCYYTGSIWQVTGFSEKLNGFSNHPTDIFWGDDMEIINMWEY